MSTPASPLNPPASAQPTAAPPEPRLFDRDRAAASVGAVALISMFAFEALATAAVMPAVATALDGLGSYALSFGGPMALSVLGMVLAGQSADRHGALRATAAGLLLFAAGLLVAGLAPGMGWLVLGRMLQGLGGGMLGVTLYVGMGQVVPAALHPRLFSLFATAWVLPGLVGPSLAAALVGWLGWRSVFLVVAAAVPVAAALLLPAYARLPAAAVNQRAQGNAAAARARLAWPRSQPLARWPCTARASWPTAPRSAAPAWRCSAGVCWLRCWPLHVCCHPAACAPGAACRQRLRCAA